MTAAPLTGVRVLEWSTSIAGAHAGRLLRDLGAAVVRVGGVPLGKATELDDYLDLGKRQVPGRVVDLPGLAHDHDADVVVLELPDAPADDLVRRFADAVVVAITPWGLDGPWAGSGRPWTEFTLQVEAGSLSTRGDDGSYPLATGSSEPLWIAGTMAAGAAVAALQGSDDRLIDVSLLEVTAYATNLFQDVAASVLGTEPHEPLHRITLRPSIEPAADGWVGFNLASRRNYLDFLDLIGRQEWADDEEMSTFLGRHLRHEEWTAATRAWTRAHRVAEIVELAGRRRIPCTPVHDGATVLEDPQVVARGFYHRPAGLGHVVPSPPFLIDGRRPERAAEPPAAPPAAPPPRPTSAPAGSQPFAGLRVVDLGTWWVGAYVGSALGAFGADVVKVESATRLDGARTLGGVPRSHEHWWECGNFHLGANFAKRSVTLDLGQEEGRALLRRLLADADVLLENYAPRVLEELGLDWEAVHALNPRLVLLRMPAFGLSGPRRSMVGYAQTVEQFSGLAWRTGYAGGEPTNPQGPADPMGGATSFLALAAVVRQARATGRGCLVEVPLVESALVMASEQVLRWSARGELVERAGNRAQDADIQGMFPAVGGEWVGVSVVGDEQWQALARAVRAERWLEDPALADRAGRQARADEVEGVVAAWVGERSADEAVAVLLAAGVPAAARVDYRFVHAHPQLAARGAYEPGDLPAVGTVPLPTLPFRRLDRPAWLGRRPPMLGEHNDEVLRGELGLDETAMASLAAAGVIRTVPVAS